MQFRATLPLDQLRRRLQDRVNEIRDGLVFGGYEFDGVLYDSDPRSLQNLTSRVAGIAAGNPLPPGYTWRSADNSNIPHDSDSLKELSFAMTAFVESAYQRSWMLKDSINASSEPETIDIKHGWPVSS